MSATNRAKKSKRPDDDLYESPPWALPPLLRHLDVAGKTVVEPACGYGLIASSLKAAGANVWLGEQDWVRGHRTAEELGMEEKLVPGDFCLIDWKRLQADAAVTNPPFRIAAEFAKHGIENFPVTALLLRLNFLGSKGRRKWLNATKPFVIVMDERPSFTIDGKTDATEYAWFVWGEGFTGRGYTIEEVGPHERDRRWDRFHGRLVGGLRANQRHSRNAEGHS